MGVPPSRNSVQAEPQKRPAQSSFVKQTRGGTGKFNTRKWLIGGGALIIVVGGYWYFSLHNHGSEGLRNGPRVAGAPVRVAKVERRDMAVVERVIGTVMANSVVQVTPQVQGLVKSAFFKEGQLVKKGDLLFQIDPEPFQVTLDQTMGQLTKDQAALDGARRDLKRYQSLMAVNAESQQVVDDQMATVATDEGVVRADMANVKMAGINLRYTQIRSPVDGKTGPIMIFPGNIISVTGTTSTVTPLVTIDEIQPIKISFFLPQSDLPRIQAREKTGILSATIDMSDAGGKSFAVPVDYIGNAVNNLTGTIELRATYQNSDAVLVPGQVNTVVVELNNIPNATVIPHDALTAGPAGQYVYVVSNGRAKQVPVQVLFDDSKSVAVQADLNPGDDVVTDGQLQTVPGGAVQIITAANSAGGQKNRNRGRRQSKSG